MSAPRAILHVDMDAFYASVEQRDRPELRGQPVIVGGTSNRGVVAAASYEVRRFGVRSAMPMREALRRCPQAVVVAPRFKRYREISGQVFEIFREFTDQVEGLSLDEAFLDVTGSTGLFGSGEAMAREIKKRIHERTGLTASVGVSETGLTDSDRQRVGVGRQRLRVGPGRGRRRVGARVGPGDGRQRVRSHRTGGLPPRPAPKRAEAPGRAPRP